MDPTVAKQNVMRKRTRLFQDLNTAQKAAVLEKVIRLRQQYGEWAKRDRPLVWARCVRELESFIVGSEYRFSVHG